MRRILIDTDPAYNVNIGPGLIGHLGSSIQELEKQPESIMIVTDSTVGPLYAKQVQDALSHYHTIVHTFPAGEAYKTPETLLGILRTMAQHELTRSDLVLALGGGVVGDMAGFAAAVFQRGMRFIQCPTTWLSAVDASVGGKTAVDLPEGKNMIGAFHQPAMVVCDVETFKTLPELRFADGAAEMIKHGVIASPELFARMKDLTWRLDPETTVAMNVEIKRSFVLGDVHDQADRQMLNFGHTIGHAIEAWSDFKLSHGQAVAIGMVMETRAARKLGLSDLDESELIAVLNKNGLPTETEASSEEILEFALHDKKRRCSGVTVVIPERIGRARLQTLDMETFKRYIEAGRS